MASNPQNGNSSTPASTLARPRRTRRVRRFAVVFGILFVVAGVGVAAFVRWASAGPELFRRAHTDVAVELVPIARGLVEPLYAVAHPDGSAEVFVVEKRGAIWRLPLLDAGAVAPVEPAGEPFLDLRGEVINDTWERGMYALAFHPRFEENGRFIVSYTAAPDGRVLVVEFTVDPLTGRAEAASRREILSVAKPINPDGLPNDSHNGGHIAFGPKDGYLYVSIGDGNRPRLTDLGSQDLDSLRGKILRLDVDGAEPYAVPSDNPFVDVEGARGEIWALGLRNPWRFTFDPDGSTLWVGDVGQNYFEEIDLVRAGGNYGWPVREGRLWSWRDNLKAMGITKDTWNQPGTVLGSLGKYMRYVGRSFEPPVLDYAQVDVDPEGGQSVLAGLIYEGSAIPQLRGRFLFGDFVTGRFWSLEMPSVAGDDAMPVRYDLLATRRLPSSITPDNAGEVLVTDYANGELLRMLPVEALN